MERRDKDKRIRISNGDRPLANGYERPVDDWPIEFDTIVRSSGGRLARDKLIPPVLRERGRLGLKCILMDTLICRKSTLLIDHMPS